MLGSEVGEKGGKPVSEERRLKVKVWGQLAENKHTKEENSTVIP